MAVGPCGKKKLDMTATRGDEQPQRIGRAFVDLVRDQLGRDEEDADHHQHHQQHKGNLVSHIQLILDEVRHQGGQHGEAETAQDEGDHQDDERLVLERGQDCLDRRQLGRLSGQFRSFLDREGGNQGGGDGDRPEDCPGGAPGLLQVQPGALEDASQDGGQRCAQDVTENAEDHADRGQAGAFVVITGQFGGQGVVGGGGHGVESVHQPEAEQHGQEGSHAGQALGQREHDPGGDAQRHGADQHVDPPPTKARAGAVRPVAEERIVDRIPGQLADHQGQSGQGRVDPGHVGVVEEQEELHGRGDQGKAQVGQTVPEFAAKGKFLIHGMASQRDGDG